MRAEGVTLGYGQRDVRVPSFQLLKNMGCAKAQDVYMASLRFWVVFWMCFYSCAQGSSTCQGGTNVAGLHGHVVGSHVVRRHVTTGSHKYRGCA